MCDVKVFLTFTFVVKILQDFYQGLTSKVKWAGGMSESFNIKQGVRQRGVLSTFLYKIYNNTFLKDLQKHNLGFSIGNYCYWYFPPISGALPTGSNLWQYLCRMSNMRRRHSPPLG